MCCYDTEENGRTEYTRRTLESLLFTVDWSKHRLIIVDNNSCVETKALLKNHKLPEWTLITLSKNIGTAKGINMGLRMRNPQEFCVKLDNDVVIHQNGWVDEMEEVFSRDPTIGIVGLKRKDIDFDANHENPSYRSKLIQLPHKPGETWITVEGGGQIMGTCTMFNWRLVDTIGGMKQILVYSLDDTLYDLRSTLAGFWNCYLPHINIDHIDDGSNPYTQQKHKIALDSWTEYMALHEAYCNGTRPLYEEI